MKPAIAAIAALGLAACAHGAPPLNYPPSAQRDLIDCEMYAAAVTPKHISLWRGELGTEWQHPKKLRAATQRCMAARGWGTGD